MPITISADFKKKLLQLSDKELAALVVRAAKRDDELYDTLRFELLQDVDVASIQADTEDKIHELFNLSVSGYLLTKSLPKVLGKATKEVARARRRVQADLDGCRFGHGRGLQQPEG